jgi:chromate transporter
MTPPAEGDAPLAPSSWRAFLMYFLRLGTFGFGGPIALAGYMQRDLVERRRWIARRDYVQGLALAQLAPGPLAAQLAMYLGWVKAGVRGATLVSAAFILPSLLMVLALSAAYVRFGGLPWMQSAFYGVGAAVIAIIGRSAVKLIKLTLARDRLLWAVFAVSAVATAWTESEVAWLFLASGVLVLLVRAPPRVAPPAVAALIGPAGLASWSAQPRRLGQPRRGGRCSVGWRCTLPRRARSCSAADWPSSPSCTAAS